MKQALCGLLLLLVMGCASTDDRAWQRYEFEEPQMGVPFKITMYAPSQAAAEKAADGAFARIKQLNDIMSDYEYDSELSALSRTAGTGQTVKISDDLWRVLAAAQRFSVASEGAFDVTIGSMVTHWRRARRTGELPTAQQLAAARDSFGYTNLVLDWGKAQITKQNVRLDLGAIAKGYAADEALKVLRAQGIRRAIVAASGDMAIGDAPPTKKGWRIQLLNAEKSRHQFLLLKNCALATSGDLFQHVLINGVRYSHIVDPRTGLGLTDQSLVTVVAKDAMTADALATSISVLGPERGLKVARDFAAEARFTRVNEEKTTAAFWKFAE